jgi:hypothetical protein
MSRRIAPATPLAELTEKQFEQQLIGSNGKPGIARVLGWRCYHTLRSKGSEPGYPDWTLVRDRVVFLELKREQGVVSDTQRDWIAALLNGGAEVYIVRPHHLEAITAVLRHRYRPRADEQPLFHHLQHELDHELERSTA